MGSTSRTASTAAVGVVHPNLAELVQKNEQTWQSPTASTPPRLPFEQRGRRSKTRRSSNGFSQPQVGADPSAERQKESPELRLRSADPPERGPTGPPPSGASAALGPKSAAETGTLRICPANPEEFKVKSTDRERKQIAFARCKQNC